jgi:hypothetical protein
MKRWWRRAWSRHKDSSSIVPLIIQRKNHVDRCSNLDWLAGKKRGPITPFPDGVHGSPRRRTATRNHTEFRNFPRLVADRMQSYRAGEPLFPRDFGIDWLNPINQRCGCDCVPCFTRESFSEPLACGPAVAPPRSGPCEESGVRTKRNPPSMYAKANRRLHRLLGTFAVRTRKAALDVHPGYGKSVRSRYRHNACQSGPLRRP